MFKIDLTYLETISGGDREFIHEMLKMLLNSTFTEMDAIKRHAAAGQWVEMGNLAHKIKAPIQMLGVSEVSNLILEVEQQGKNQNDTQTIRDKVALLDSYMTELSGQVQQLLNK